MKKRALRNVLLIAPVIILGLGIGLGLSKISASRKLGGTTRQFPPTQAAAPADNRTLREKAKEKGQYVADKSPTKVNAYSDLKGLAKDSSAVIIGIPQDNVSTLSADGKSITLDYKVKVMYVYKGALQEGNIITVSLPGGRVSFEDGSMAEIRSPWFKKMMGGKAYALFLTPAPRAGAYATTGEAEGLFEVPMTAKDIQTVQTHSGLPNDPIWKYQGKDAKAFFKELRQATGKPLKK